MGRRIVVGERDEACFGRAVEFPDPGVREGVSQLDPLIRGKLAAADEDQAETGRGLPLGRV